MYYVYILESVPTGRYYIGSTKDIEHRLRKHNAGHSVATKAYRPWRLVHQEEFLSRGDALRREYEIKRHKSRSYISSLRD
ncbi:GIY-YIG nuclease family protein [bacterium]|nr:GIY-YIG nuclease family protein [bacterium]